MAVNDQIVYDTIIVGGGFSGLMAARTLHRAGRKVLVLEARERLGGRIHTHWLNDDTYVDLGGQWIGPTQDHMYRLLDEYGLSYFRTYDEGLSLTYLDGKLKQYKGLIPPLPVPGLLNLHFAIQRINRLAKKINLDQPWLSPKVKAWDGQSLHDWMNRFFHIDKARRLFKIGIESVYACDPADISFLHTLFYCASGGNLDLLFNIDNGAQQDKIYGGAQLIADRMAEEFKDSIVLSTPVEKIDQHDAGIAIHSGEQLWNAKYAIVAIPPVLIGRINFAPALPSERQQTLAQYFMGSVVKCYAIYDKPFWRARKLNGIVATDGGFISVCFDNSPRDAEKGMIMAFVLANKAKIFSQHTPKERQKIILSELVQFFGAEAAEPLHYIDKAWENEPYSKGCYAGMLPPKAWTSITQPLHQPVGRIHWAGTETAAVWNGYMEGAIRAGIRAANEVQDRL